MGNKATNIIGFFIGLGILVLANFTCDHVFGGNDSNDTGREKRTDNNEENDQAIPSRSSSTNGGGDCGFEDGTHSASVDYLNYKTGYSNTYELEVVVKDCQVVEIDFPKGGWLDGDHIDPTDIDDSGDASIIDDKGRSFDVHIDE